MRLGITGTRDGMTDRQKDELWQLLEDWDLEGVHHGDCVGVDAEAHEMAKELNLYVVVHPPTDPKYRAWCVGDEMRDELPYIKRNHAIVDEVSHLFVAPRTRFENSEPRSGTWATYRYADDQQIQAIWLALP